MSAPIALAGLAASVIGLDLAIVATWYLAANALIATAAIAASYALTPKLEASPEREYCVTVRWAEASPLRAG